MTVNDDEKRPSAEGGEDANDGGGLKSGLVVSAVVVVLVLIVLVVLIDRIGNVFGELFGVLGG